MRNIKLTEMDYELLTKYLLDFQSILSHNGGHRKNSGATPRRINILLHRIKEGTDPTPQKTLKDFIGGKKR